METDHGARADVRRVIAGGPFADTWTSLAGYRVPEWYQDAKFGIFIHWGVYAVPAFGSEWYPREMYREGRPELAHHRERYGPLTQFGYKDFIPLFTAERFDADEWAELFRRAGAQYVVPVAEHHDGFALYNSRRTEWTAAHMGPKRDLIGEIAAAVRRQWLVFGVSSHRAEHWWFFNGGMRVPSDVQEGRYAGLYGPAQSEHLPPNEPFLEDWLLRTVELVDLYEPQIVYFDWWIEQPAFAPYLQEFAAYYYNRAAAWRRGVVINYKYHAFPEGTAVYDMERGQQGNIRHPYWQTDTGVSKNSWGYVEPQQYKTAHDVLCDLIDIVSKNGGLLLNIGPRADGTIPEPERDLLLALGRWLTRYGEAIYGTRPWKRFGEGPNRVPTGVFIDAKRAPYTAADIRFTSRGDTVYALVMAWPDDHRVRVRSWGRATAGAMGPDATIHLLGHEPAVPWRQDEEALVVELPPQRREAGPLALRLTPTPQERQL